MTNFDLENIEWGEFIIGEEFQVQKVKGLPMEKYKSGKTPYLSTSAQNNALIGFIDGDSSIINNKKCLSVDPIKGKIFYHDYDFVGRGFSGASINLLYNTNINRYTGLFIVKTIEQTSFFKASYANLFNSNRLKLGKILLPKDSAGNPDWDFMENYMREKEKKILGNSLEYYKSKISPENLRGGGNY